MSNKSIEHALGYAKAARADIVALSIVPTSPHGDAKAPDRQPRLAPVEKRGVAADMLAETVAEAARRIGVHCDTVDSALPGPVEAILDVYKRYCCDVIYISSHRRSGEESMAASCENLASQVLERSTAPVLVFR